MQKEMQNRKAMLEGLPRAVLKKTNALDSVLDNVIELISVQMNVDGKIEVVASAAYTEVKPYIAMKVRLTDTQQGETSEEMGNFIEDSNELLFQGCFEPLQPDCAEEEVHIDITAFWVNPEGDKERTELSEDVTVSSAPLEKLQVEMPRAADGKCTKVLYGTYTAGDTYDYKYPDNRAVSGTVKAMLPLKGSLSFGKEWHPTAINIWHGNAPKLYMMLSTGGVIPYGKSLNDIFTFEDNRVCFELPDGDDWGSVIEVSRLGYSVYFDLYFSFTVNMKNDYFPTQDYTARAAVMCKQNLQEYPTMMVEVIEPVYLYWDCMAENTFVSLYPEKEKRVSELQEGDTVMDGDGNGRRVVRVVSCKAENIVHIVTETGRTLDVTGNHMLKTYTGFKRAGDMASCGYVLVRDGDGEHQEYLLSVESQDYEGMVYHVELEDGGTMLANGIVSLDACAVGRQNQTWKETVLKSRAALHSAIWE